jgi:hypothetical protein
MFTVPFSNSSFRRATTMLPNRPHGETNVAEAPAPFYAFAARARRTGALYRYVERRAKQRRQMAIQKCAPRFNVMSSLHMLV